MFLNKSNKKIKNLSGFLKIGESYTSLILGIIAVIIVTILVIVFVRQNSQSVTDEEAAMVEEQEGVHTVAEGETLWIIAEEEYGSGYNWVDIAQANNIESPDAIEAGDELELPDVEPKTLTVVEEAISGEPEAMEEEAVEEEEVAMEAEEDSSEKVTGEKYTVKQGDHLWDIAVRAYGDGFRWVDIARANNLVNPDIIHPGNELTLPRN